MGNTPTHPKLFEVDEEIRILQDAVNDAKRRKEIIYQTLLFAQPVCAEKQIKVIIVGSWNGFLRIIIVNIPKLLSLI